MNTTNHKFISRALILMSITFFSCGKALASPPYDFEMPFWLSMASKTRLVDVGQDYVGTIKFSCES